MRFGPDEVTAYDAARDRLIDDFRARTVEPDRAGQHVGSLLDFKWGYLDGDLLTWRVEHVEEFLVDWLPRKVTLPDEVVAEVAPELMAFFTFLEATGRLDARSDPYARLVAIAGRARSGTRRAHARPIELGTGESARERDACRRRRDRRRGCDEHMDREVQLRLARGT